MPIETIYYSSYVLNKYSVSQNYFEESEGVLKEKILGLKLLESNQANSSERKEKLKDIGDTTLCLLGVFSDSVNKKILDEKYYANIGMTAYKQLNSIEPNYLDVPNFYENLSGRYFKIVEFLSIFTRDFFNSKDERNLLKVS